MLTLIHIVGRGQQTVGSLRSFYVMHPSKESGSRTYQKTQERYYMILFYQSHIDLLYLSSSSIKKEFKIKDLYSTKLTTSFCFPKHDYIRLEIMLQGKLILALYIPHHQAKPYSNIHATKEEKIVCRKKVKL